MPLHASPPKSILSCYLLFPGFARIWKGHIARYENGPGRAGWSWSNAWTPCYVYMMGRLPSQGHFMIQCQVLCCMINGQWLQVLLLWKAWLDGDIHPESTLPACHRGDACDENSQTEMSSVWWITFLVSHSTLFPIFGMFLGGRKH